jgi:hypothetical protein
MLFLSEKVALGKAPQRLGPTPIYILDRMACQWPLKECYRVRAPGFEYFGRCRHVHPCIIKTNEKVDKLFEVLLWDVKYGNSETKHRSNKSRGTFVNADSVYYEIDLIMATEIWKQRERLRRIKDYV